MSQASIQNIINRGNGIAANVVGSTCQWYRPTNTAFITSGQLLGTINAYFDPKPNLMAKVASSFAHPEWSVAVDRTNLQQFDYLVDPNGNTYFLNAMQPLTPTGAILCNSVVSIYRPTTDQAPGPNYYGGNISGDGVLQIGNCPCSILQGTKGEKDMSGVVAEGRQPWVSIVLPAITGVELWVADILIDDQGRRYQLSSIEKSILGMRLTAQYAGT